MHKTLSTGLMLVALLVSLPGCSSLIASQTGKLADNISSAIYNSNDVESVGQAIPTFLVLIDSMIEGNPENPDLLKTGAQLNDAYAGVFVAEPERRSKISTKSLNYAWRSICAYDDDLCDWQQMDYPAFDRAVAELKEDDLDYAYTLAVSWLNWIRANSEDWNAVAELPRSERILQQVVALNDSYDNGMAHLYLGGIATLLPPALGGKPELGKMHFERAIEISDGKNMMAKVVYADQYARMMFDRDLHHRLLTEVIDGDPEIPGFVLINTVAQQEAKLLLADEADYF
jgi:hypothetical protein